MSNVTARHVAFTLNDDGLTDTMVSLRHFTRQGIKDAYVQACLDDPLYAVDYVGEDVVIVTVRPNG